MFPGVEVLGAFPMSFLETFDDSYLVVERINSVLEVFEQRF